MSIVGIVSLVVGIVFLYFGYQSSQVIAERLIEGVSGRYSSNTMWYIIAGIVMLTAGSLLTFFGRKK